MYGRGRFERQKGLTACHVEAAMDPFLCANRSAMVHINIAGTLGESVNQKSQTSLDCVLPRSPVARWGPRLGIGTWYVSPYP
jgi:hypothetical protein